ncbi:MAG: TonB-dependent receptor [Saprospiraceae bacterium]|nr:TonB-dependent receptor [Saprospiraceae bacterium]
MTRIYIYIGLISLSSFIVHAQAQQTLSGRVVVVEGKPLAYATALLLTASDSTMVKGAITDEAGHYVFEDIGAGTYSVAVSMVGYQTTQTGSFTLRQGFSSELPDIVLKEGITLDEVSVTGTKLMYELKQDRIVMNIDAFPSMSGNSGLELLQKIPGIIVDRQNNSIGMNAKGEVLVMINNKIQRISAEVLMVQLQGMRAENIKQIEIIHQPPAKYDASGAAGIIHIVLKKNDQHGTNGSVALTGGYGQQEKAGLGLNLNSRKGKLNWYGDYNYNRGRANEYYVNHFREYEYDGNRYYYQNFVTLNNYSENQHAANLGLDVDFDGRTMIGFVVGSSISELVWGSGADSRSFEYVNDELVGQGDYLFGTKTDMSSLSTNVNVLQKIGSDSHLNFNLDYAKIRYGNSGDLQDKDDPDHAIEYERSTPMQFWIAGLDYENKLGDAWTMETGIKSMFNNTMNNTAFHSQNDEYWANSDLFDKEEKIKEQILAAYLSFKGKLSEKIDVELGLRYEDYSYRLEREEQKDFNKTFKKPFPVVRLNYKIDSLNTVQLGFNRSTTRPSFFHLTSFLLLFDPSLIVYANPQLQPTFTNTLKVSWQRKSIILSLSYLSRTNQIYFYNTVDKENHLQTSLPVNLDRENIVEGNLSFPLFPFRWWEMNLNFNAYYHRVKDESSRPAIFEKNIFTYAAQFNFTFLLKNQWSIGMDGMYKTPFLVGDQRWYDYPYLNLGVRKKFPSGNSLNFTIQSIPRNAATREWEYDQPELGVRTFGDHDLAETQVRVTYTALFGNQKLSGKRLRKTGSDEVKSRM